MCICDLCSLARFQSNTIAPVRCTNLSNHGVGEHDVRLRHTFLYDGQCLRIVRAVMRGGECYRLRPVRTARIGIGGDRYGLVPRCRRVGQVDIVSTPIAPRYCGNGHRLGNGPVGVGADGDGLSRSTSSRDGDGGRADGEVSVASGLRDSANDCCGTTAIRRDG